MTYEKVIANNQLKQQHKLMLPCCLKTAGFFYLYLYEIKIKYMSDIIRKLTIGSPDFGLSYEVGQSFNRGKPSELKVTFICLDAEYLTKFGIDKYDIYAADATGSEDKQAKIWKSFIRQKTMIEFNLFSK